MLSSGLAGTSSSSEDGAWQPTPVFFPGGSPWTEEPGEPQPTGSQRFGDTTE